MVRRGKIYLRLSDMGVPRPSLTAFLTTLTVFCFRTCETIRIGVRELRECNGIFISPRQDDRSGVGRRKHTKLLK